MHQPANDFRSPDDWDDAERLEIEVKAARVRADALQYRGRPDLLELAIEVSRELVALNRELSIAQRERRPKAERIALLERE
jgi:hypothetical protein